MKTPTPTTEEVKEYFKDPLEVRCVIDLNLYKFKNVKYSGESNNMYYSGERNTIKVNDHSYCALYTDNKGYAEITKYKPKTLKNPTAKHYELWGDFEAVDVIKASLTPEEYKGYLKGNILKYKLRDKNQDESDKIKIKDYQNELNALL